MHLRQKSRKCQRLMGHVLKYHLMRERHLARAESKYMQQLTESPMSEVLSIWALNMAMAAFALSLDVARIFALQMKNSPVTAQN